MKDVLFVAIFMISGVTIAGAQSAAEQLGVSIGPEISEPVSAVPAAGTKAAMPEVTAAADMPTGSDVKDAGKDLSQAKDYDSQIVFQASGVAENGASCGYKVRQGENGNLFAVYTNDTASQTFKITYSGNEGERGEFSNYAPASYGFGFTPAERSDGSIVITRDGVAPGTAMVKVRNCIKRLFWSCADFSEKCTEQR